MNPILLRNGLWVLFRGNLEGAFRARDGRIVGIVCIGPYGEDSAAFIAVVDENGDNLMVEVGGRFVDAKVSINQPDLAPVMNKKDLPPKRAEHLPASWRPRGF